MKMRIMTLGDDEGVIEIAGEGELEGKMKGRRRGRGKGRKKCKMKRKRRPC